MEEKRSSTASLAIFAALGLLLPCLYVGGYYCLLDECTLYHIRNNQLRLGIAPNYSIESEWVEIAFTPVHLFDTYLRPQHWELGAPKELPKGFDILNDELSSLRWDKNGRLLPADEPGGVDAFGLPVVMEAVESEILP